MSLFRWARVLVVAALVQGACGDGPGEGPADPGVADLAPGDDLAADGVQPDAADVPAGDAVAADVPGDDTAPPDASPDAADAVPGDGGPDLPPRVCRAPTPWAPGRRAFTDVSEAAGLRAMNVVGVRLNAVDWDGDGRPDLVVRGYDGRRDDLDGNTVRNTFLLRNEGGLAFADRTRASGFLATRDGGEGRVAQGVVWGDLDNDGDLDALTTLSVDPDLTKPDVPDRNEVLLNDGDGTFTLAEGGAVRAADERLPVVGLSLADVDRDGFLDAWIATGSGPYGPLPDRLYRGDGAGGFAEVSTPAGIVTADWSLGGLVESGRGHRFAFGGSACDLNGDGWPDLVTSAYGRYFNAYWQGGPGGLFADRSADSGIADDGRRDWSTNLNAQCYCKLTPDAEGCAGVPAPPSFFRCTSTSGLRWDHAQDRKPYRLGGNNGVHACGDVDNDGDLDLLVLTIVHWDVGDTSDPSELLLNDGAADVRFTRPGNAATGLVRDFGRVDWNAGDMSGGFLDFDGDGRLDLIMGSSDYPGTRAFLFHQRADGTFEEVAVADGIDQPRTHGVTVADFDGDGDVDVALGHGRSRCGQDPTDRCYPTQEIHLFRNDVGQDANFLRVVLEPGPGANRAAIGARVRVTAGGVTQTAEVNGGYGQVGAQNDLALTFGLGAACDVEKVEVRWPDLAGTTETWTGLRANYTVRLAAGALAPQYLSAP